MGKTYKDTANYFLHHETVEGKEIPQHLKQIKDRLMHNKGLRYGNQRKQVASLKVVEQRNQKRKTNFQERIESLF